MTEKILTDKGWMVKEGQDETPSSPPAEALGVGTKTLTEKGWVVSEGVSTAAAPAAIPASPEDSFKLTDGALDVDKVNSVLTPEEETQNDNADTSSEPSSSTELDPDTDPDTGSSDPASSTGSDAPSGAASDSSDTAGHPGSSSPSSKPSKSGRNSRKV